MNLLTSCIHEENSSKCLLHDYRQVKNSNNFDLDYISTILHPVDILKVDIIPDRY